MSAAGLDHWPEFVRLLLQLSLKVFQSWDQVFFYGNQSSQLDRAGNNIVGRLSQIDVVIGVHYARTQVSTQELGSHVGDDLVGVGVGRCTGPGLKNIQDEVMVMLAVDDFLGGFADSVPNFLIQHTQSHIGLGGSLLDQTQRADEGAGKAKIADGEIQHRPHGGCPV